MTVAGFQLRPASYAFASYSCFPRRLQLRARGWNGWTLPANFFFQQPAGRARSRVCSNSRAIARQQQQEQRSDLEKTRGAAHTGTYVRTYVNHQELNSVLMAKLLAIMVVNTNKYFTKIITLMLKREMHAISHIPWHMSGHVSQCAQPFTAAEDASPNRCASPGRRWRQTGDVLLYRYVALK